MHKRYVLAVPLFLFLVLHKTAANANTCRVAGICGDEGGFKQLNFDLSDVGGMPIIQGPPGADGLDATVTQDMLDGIRDSVLQEMNTSLANIQDTSEDLIINMHRLEMLVFALQNNGTVTSGNDTISSNMTGDILSMIQSIETSLDLQARSVADLDQQVNSVGALLDGQNQILTKLNEDVRQLKYTSECPGITVGDSCYFVIHQRADHQTAEKECAKSHATLASITNQELYDALYNNYIVNEVIMADQASVLLWLGSSVSSEMDIIDPDGQMVNYTNWLPGWPRDPDTDNRHQMTWLVLSNPNITYHGMLNSVPMTMSYPLCTRAVPVQAEGHCAVLDSPQNGSIQFVGSSHHTSVNSVAVVTCHAGFAVAENEAYVLICTETGAWSSPLPLCLPTTN